jgi:hypothetical protein
MVSIKPGTRHPAARVVPALPSLLPPATLRRRPASVSHRWAAGPVIRHCVPASEDLPAASHRWVATRMDGTGSAIPSRQRREAYVFGSGHGLHHRRECMQGADTPSDRVIEYDDPTGDLWPLLIHGAPARRYAPSQCSPTATTGPRRVALRWTAAIDTGGSGLVGYEVLRASSAGGSWTVVAAPTSASWTDTGLVEGRTYW